MKNITLADMRNTASQHSLDLDELARQTDGFSPIPGGRGEKFSLKAWAQETAGYTSLREALGAGQQPARIVLWGEAGTGKTTLVRRLTGEELERLRRGDREAFYPIVASLGDYAAAVLKERKTIPLADHLLGGATNPWYAATEMSGPDGFLERTARRQWETGRVVVILEGYEEIFSHMIAGGSASDPTHVGLCDGMLQAIRDFAAGLSERHALIVTCRPLPGGPEVFNGQRCIRLAPLEEGELEAFTRGMIRVAGGAEASGGQMERIYQRLEKEWREVADFARALRYPEVLAVAVWEAAAQEARGPRRSVSQAGEISRAVFGLVWDRKLEVWARRWLHMNPADASHWMHSHALKDSMAVLGGEWKAAGGAMDSAAFASAMSRAAAKWKGFARLHGPWADLAGITVMDSGLLVETGGSIRLQYPGLRPLITQVAAVPPADTPDREKAILDYVRQSHTAFEHTINQNTEYYVRLDAENGGMPRPTIDPPYPYARRSKLLRANVQMVADNLDDGYHEMAMNLSGGLPDSPPVRDVASALMASREPLVLLGSPGAGKSLTMNETALRLAKRFLSPKFGRKPMIPVLIRMGEFRLKGDKSERRKCLMDYIKEQLGNGSSIIPYLEELDEEGRIVWLFDAMDEMGRDGYETHAAVLSDFANETCRQDNKGHKGNKAILSCRKTDFISSVKHKTLILLPFDVRQVATFVEKYLSFSTPLVIGKEVFKKPLKLAERLTSQEMLERLGQDNVGNPFLLKLLCRYLLRHHQWPESRVKLLRAYLEEEYWRAHCKRNEDSGVMTKSSEESSTRYLEKRNQLFDDLASFAYVISIRGQGCYMPEKELLEMEGGAGREPMSVMIEEGRRCGILAARNDQGTIGFEHHRFDEFFTALYLSRNNAGIDWLEKLDSPRWLETMQNLILMYGESEGAPATIDAALEALIGAISEPFVAKAVGVREFRESTDPAKAKPFDFKEEIDLSLRIEVAARIVGQAHGVVPRVAQDLMPVVRETLGMLVEVGRDASVVRMMFASQHLPAGDVIPHLQKAVEGRCELVTRECFKLRMTSANFCRHIGEGQNIHLVSLAEGKHLENRRNVKDALKKTDDASIHRAARVGAICFYAECVAVVLLIGLMGLAGPFWPTYWRWGQDWWEPVHRALVIGGEILLKKQYGEMAFGLPSYQLLLSGLVAVAALIGVLVFGMDDKRRPKASAWARGAIVGGAIPLFAIGAVILVPAAVAMYGWAWSTVLVVIGGVVCLGFSLLLWWHLYAIIRFLCLAAFSLTNSSPGGATLFGSPGFYVAKVWRGIFGSGRAALISLSLAVIGLGMLLAMPVLLSIVFHSGADPRTFLIGMAAVICIVLVGGWLIAAAGFRKWLFMMIFERPLTVFLFFVAIGAMWLMTRAGWFTGVFEVAPVIGDKLSWVGTVFKWIAIAIGCVLGLAVGLWLLLVGGAIVWAILVGLFQAYKEAAKYASGEKKVSWPKATAAWIKPSPESWVRSIKAGSAHEQCKILMRGYGKLDITAQEFQDLLEKVEPDIKGDPARSAYGEVVMQVVDSLRHDKVIQDE